VISAVPIQIQQLLINLIGNAIKYSRENTTPVIRVTSEKASRADLKKERVNPNIDYWKISVKDNGIGFDQQYSEKIFEVFQRLHSKDQFTGTGIGLAICRKIVQTHKGYIFAHGETGKGATFNIFLPAILKTEEDTAPQTRETAVPIRN
jgi:signal transduction histidine kinase